MISDDTLYRLANYLGSVAVLLIVLYAWIEVNAKDAKEAAPVVPVGKQGASLK